MAPLKLCLTRHMHTFEQKANDFPLFSTIQQFLKPHLNKPKCSLHNITPDFIGGDV